MAVLVERSPGRYRVLAAEAFGADAAPAFEGILLGLKASPGHVVVDLRHVNAIGSTGLGLLVAVHKAAEEAGRRLVLLAPSAAVRSLLSISALDRLLRIADTDPEAEAILSGGAGSGGT